jgi:hypothetical protein
MNLSTSSKVFSAPQLIRIAQRPSSSAIPIACSTWLSPNFPEEHAAPALTSIPARSSAIICVSASIPGRANKICDPANRQSPLLRLPRRDAETGNTRNVLRPPTVAAFLPAALDERLNLYTFSQNQRPHPFWTTQFMSRDRQHIDTEALHIDGNTPHRLYRIAMDQRARSGPDGARSSIMILAL